MNVPLLNTVRHHDMRSLPTVLVLSLDAAVVDRAATALAGLAQVHRADPIEDSAMLSVPELKPVLCIVDAQDAGQGLVTLLAGLKRMAPAASLVALGDDGAADLILTCMRAGASDFIARQTGDAALRRSLRGRLERGARETASERQGPAFGIFGARPSDPSRLHALALATSRARAGRGVLFLDLAPGSQETAIALDITPTYGVNDALADLDRLDQALLGSAVPRHDQTGLSTLLLDPATPEGALAGGDVTTLLVLLRGVYDEVVLHAGASMLAAMPFLLGGLQRFALVTTQHLASAQAAAECLRKLSDQGVAVEGRAVLVVTEYLASVLPAPNTIAGSIGVGRVLAIPDERSRLWNAVNRGRFVEDALGDRAFDRAIAQLAAELGVEAPASSGAGMFGWLRRGGRG
jgi:pilus assembly protein CpaE